MQRVLTFTHNKKKYVSKPYDFKAACLIEEKMFAPSPKLDGTLANVGKSTVCGDAVDYLFEGTDATQDVLNSAVSAKMRMCREVHDWFMDDLNGKNDESLTKATAAAVKAGN